MTIATATVKGGLYPANGVTSLSSISGESGARRNIRQFFSDRGQLAIRQVARALMGVAAGANATKTITRVEPNVELGGKRVIETQTLVNRVTTAADVTEINGALLAMASLTTFGASPPANKDGNPLGTR
jgi:hypothetical protein